MHYVLCAFKITGLGYTLGCFSQKQTREKMEDQIREKQFSPVKSGRHQKTPNEDVTLPPGA